jgi:phenylacetate-CoA ligase
MHKLLCLPIVRRQQWRSAGYLQRLQSTLLQGTIKAAYGAIPFYKKRLDTVGFDINRIGEKDYYKKIPVLSKQEVKEAYKEGSIFNHIYLKKSISRTTSGSSGFPLTIYYDKKSYAYSEAIYARALLEQGVRLTDRIAYFWYEPFKERGFWEYLGLFKKSEVLYTQSLDKQVERLQKIGPDVIHCFPSALYVLCRHMNRQGIKLNIRLVITHGELLLDNFREEIEKTFAVKVLDQYGSNEFNRMAWQCKEYGSYHIDADNIFVEFLDNNDQEVSAGKKGRLVVTHLRNRMMPLIRYDIGDYAVKKEGVCPCGRILPLLEKLEGRKDDFIKLADGQILSPRAIGGLLERVKSLEWYHFIQYQINGFRMEIIPNELYNEQEGSFTRGILQDILGKDALLEIRVVNELSKSKTGKMRAIESRLTG